MSAPDLPTRIRMFLAKCPPAISGQNGHDRTFSVACALVNGFDLSDSDAYAFLSEWNQNCQPPWTEFELNHKISSASHAAHDKARGHLLCEGDNRRLNVKPVATPRAKPKWPATREAAQKLIAESGLGVADLWERSPLRPPDEPRPDFFLDQLFPGDPLLCLGLASDKFATRPREFWRGKERDHQFIVPSPMSKVVGQTKEGKASEHCLDNTGPRRFLVVEFDEGTADLQAATLLYLAKYSPLVMAVGSGGKSVHGWFSCAGQSEENLTKFFRYAVSLGADEHLWVKSQFVRLPDGRRDNGNDQPVYYFNPKVI